MAYLDDIHAVLQVAPSGVPTYVRLSQNENGRRMIFSVAGGEIPSGSTATISGTKPDGVLYSATCTISGSTVTVDETIQLTAAAGEWDAKIRITNGGNVIATGRIRFVIDADTVDPGAVPSDSELEGLVAEAAGWAENARSDAYGSPLAAPTAAEMTDTSRVYVYTGSESGYTFGNWYYWNGSAWASGGVYNSTAVQMDKTLSIPGMAADAEAVGKADSELKADLSEIEEETRNLNYSKMGRWGNAADGRIYARDDKYYGMETFIPVSEGERYYVSFGGITSPSTISWTYLFTDSNGSTVQRAGYTGTESRSITAPSGAENLNVFCRSDNVITVSNNAYIQIEKGTKATAYIPPISAADYIVREIVKECFQIYSFIDSTTDLDVLQKNGAYRWNAASVPQNSPVEKACRLINVRSDADIGVGWVQVAISSDVAMYMRYKTSSIWSGWVELASKTYVDDKFDTITINSGDVWEV